ncbi:permease, partial [Treponema sp. R6D11]
FQRYVPQEGFARLFGGSTPAGRGFAILMSATIGVPLYMCGGGTIPLLQTWLHNGMSMGSAAAFMITGPATKITNLGALKIVLGVKHFLFYLLFTVVFAFVGGVLVDLIYVAIFR